MKRSLTFTTVLVALVTSYSFIVSLRASIPQVPSQTWTATGDAVTARAGASGTLLLDGHVLITGGMNNAGVTASAERYSPAAGGFLAAPPMQDARANHTSTRLLDGRVLVAGGLGADGHALGSVEIYDPAANVWTPAGPLFHPRAGHTATLLPDGRVLVAGGDDSGVPTAALEVFDPSIEGFSLLEATLSVPRMGHAAALADGKVIIVGGFDGTNALASVDVYDPLIDSVSPGPSLGVARAGHSATTLLDGQVLVAGGASDTSELASAEVFDPTSNTFSTAGGSLAIARQHHFAFLLPHNNSVLIVGGTSGGNAVGAAELYVPWEGAGGSFVATNALSVARAWATGGALSVPASEFVRTGPADGLLLLTGGSASSSASNALKSAELFGFATIKTDKFDYAPGTTVTITGSGWQPGEFVALMLRESPAFDEHPLLDVQADENGNIVSTEFVPDEHDLNIQFYLTGFGAESQAQTTFKDGKAASITVATPTSVTVAAGGTAIYGAATVTFNGTFNAGNPSCTATLNATGLPTGATAVFGTNPITRTGTAGDVTTSLIVTTTASGPSATPAGTYPFKARATDGAGCQDTNVAETPSNLNLTLVVAAAKIDSVTVGSQTGTLTFGTAGSATYTVTVGRVGSSGPLDANLSLTTTLPTGATASFVPNTVHWNNGDSAAKTSTLTVTTTSATPAGSTASTVQASNPAVPGDSLTGNGTLAVGQRPVTVTFTAADKTYDGNNTAAVSGCVIATGKVGSDDVTCTVTSGTFASANASVSAQTVSATATLVGTAAGNYTVTNPVTATAKINRATAMVTVTPYNVTYDATAHTATGTATGVGGADLSSGLTLTLTTHTDAGTYAADAWSFAGGTNYNDASGTVTDKIAKADASVVVNGYSGTYDAAAHGATLAHATGVSGVNLSGGVSLGSSFTNVPGGTAHWTFSDPNYNDQSGDVAITIGKATATVAVTPYDVTYDATAHTATGTATGVGGADLSSSLTLTGTTHTNAGTYADAWSFAGGTNYNDASGTVTDTIAKADASVVVNGYSGTYDAAAHGATLAHATGVSGVNLSGGVDLGSSFTNVPGGTAHWTFSDPNYNDQSGDVAITIGKATATVAVTPYDVTYDATAHTATGTATGVGGADLSSSLTLTGTTHTNAGTYADAWSFAGGTNYNDASGTVTDQIAKADASVVVNGYSGTYDAAAHGATLAHATGVSGVNLSTGVDLGSSFTNVPGGTAHWTFSDPNYNGQSGDVAITIGKATAAVAVTPYNVTYDATAHTATGSATGIGGVSLSGLDLSGTTHTNAGTTTDTWTFTDSTGNYNNATDTVVDTIGKATATVTVTPYNATYDATAHTATGTATGVGGADLSSGLTLTGTTHTGAGTHAADAWSFAGGTNYNDASGTVTDTIAKADASVVVNGYSGTYDAAAHGATLAHATGVSGVNLSGGVDLGSSFANVPGGTAHWTFSDANYNDQSGDVAITIGKATATVVLGDLSQTYTGSPLTPTATTTPVSLAIVWTGTPQTAAGTYPVTATISESNYQGSANGSFVIGKATQAAFSLAVPASITYGLTGPATSAGGSGAGAVTFSAAASTGCAVNSSTGVISVNDASGTCAISATKAGDNNYNGPVSNGPQSVVLNKAAQNTLTVTAPSAVTYRTIGTATASGGSGTGALSFSADASTGCSVAGTAVSVTNATLPCALTATKAGDNNYNAATSAAFTVTLNKAAATVVLGNLTQFYTGGPLTPTATTTPPGLTIAWTNAPKTDTGTYSVTAAVNSPNYQGSANGSFVIGAWTTAGFFQPVDMSTTVVIWNTVKGGSTVPLKFNLFAGTTEKTSVSDIVSFFQGEISCTLGGFDDAVDSTLLTTGGTSLRYSGTSGSDGQFIQNWQTPKQPGKCYKVIMTAKDGSTISAFFKTK